MFGPYSELATNPSAVPPNSCMALFDELSARMSQYADTSDRPLLTHSDGAVLCWFTMMFSGMLFCNVNTRVGAFPVGYDNNEGSANVCTIGFCSMQTINMYTSGEDDGNHITISSVTELIFVGSVVDPCNELYIVDQFTVA